MLERGRELLQANLEYAEMIYTTAQGALEHLSSDSNKHKLRRIVEDIDDSYKTLMRTIRLTIQFFNEKLPSFSLYNASTPIHTFAYVIGNHILRAVNNFSLAVLEAISEIPEASERELTLWQEYRALITAGMIGQARRLLEPEPRYTVSAQAPNCYF